MHVNDTKGADKRVTTILKDVKVLTMVPMNLVMETGNLLVHNSHLFAFIAIHMYCFCMYLKVILINIFACDSFIYKLIFIHCTLFCITNQFTRKTFKNFYFLFLFISY